MWICVSTCDAPWCRSPDGLCLLTCSDDNVLRLFNTPPEYYTGASAQGSSLVCIITTVVVHLSHVQQDPVLAMREGETIYDYAWLPSMASSDAATCWSAAHMIAALVMLCTDTPAALQARPETTLFTCGTPLP